MEPSIITSLLMWLLPFLSPHEPTSNSGVVYPEVRRDDDFVLDYGTFQVEYKHGPLVHQVKDPYHWLENTNSTEFHQFVEGQNHLTSTYLSNCSERNEIRERMEKLWDVPYYESPQIRGARYFYLVRKGIHPFKKESMVFQDEVGGEAKVVIQDLGQISGMPELSRNGSFIVWREADVSTAHNTSLECDDVALKVMNVTSGEVLPETISKTCGGIAWNPNNEGFFYVRSVDEFTERVFYHRVGTNENEDLLVKYVLEKEDGSRIVREPSWTLPEHMVQTEDGEWIAVLFAGNKIFLLTDLADIDSNRKGKELWFKLKFAFNSTGIREFISGNNNYFYFSSDDANVVEVDIQSGSRRVVFTPNRTYSYHHFTPVAGGKVVVHYSTSIRSQERTELRSLADGRILKAFLGRAGESWRVSSHDSSTDLLVLHERDEDFPSVYVYNTTSENASMTLLTRPTSFSHIASWYKMKHVKFPDLEVERGEVYIYYKSDIPLDGSSVAVIMLPLPTTLREHYSFMNDFEAVIAIPYSNATFPTNAISATAKYLTSHGFTSPSKLIGYGVHDFGTALALSANENPDLFGALVLTSTAMDKLLYKSRFVQELVSPSKGHKLFVRKSPQYSLQVPTNKSVQYPAALFFEEVGNMESFKFLADLQYQFGGRGAQVNPILLRVDDSGWYSDYSARLDREIQIRCFLLKSLGIEFKNGIMQ